MDYPNFAPATKLRDSYLGAFPPLPSRCADLKNLGELELLPPPPLLKRPLSAPFPAPPPLAPPQRGGGVLPSLFFFFNLNLIFLILRCRAGKAVGERRASLPAPPTPVEARGGPARGCLGGPCGRRPRGGDRTAPPHDESFSSAARCVRLWCRTAPRAWCVAWAACTVVRRMRTGTRPICPEPCRPSTAGMPPGTGATGCCPRPSSRTRGRIISAYTDEPSRRATLTGHNIQVMLASSCHGATL